MIVSSMRMNLHRRHIHVLELVALLILVSAFQYLCFNSAVGYNALQYLMPTQRKLEIAILNSQLSHDEVLIPLLDSWLRVPHASVKTYQAGYRFGMNHLIDTQGWPAAMKQAIDAGEFRKVGQEDRYPLPDILVSTTCTRDFLALNSTYAMLLDNHHTHLFCVFHHADRMLDSSKRWKMESFMSPWVRANRIDFVALSPHVSEYARLDVLGRKWKAVMDELHHPRFHVFPPIFEFNLPPGSNCNGKGREAGFSIQGEYSRGRDYDTVFPLLQKMILAAEERNDDSVEATNLHLVGFGQHPDMPADLQSHVIFDERLDYTEFYSTLAQSDAIMTAFSSEEYYTVKASSSVAAALIAGTPLVGDAKLLKSYGYLNESAMWMRAEGESEMDTVSRVMALTREEKNAKKAAVRKLRSQLITKNRMAVQACVEHVVASFPKGWYLR
jgi:hypothetical protein